MFPQVSMLFERIAHREAHRTRLRYDRLGAIAEDGRILIGGDPEVVSQVVDVQCRDPVREREAESRVNHGITGHRWNGRGERRENSALVMSADAIAPLTAEQFDMPIFERNGCTGLR